MCPGQQSIVGLLAHESSSLAQITYLDNMQGVFSFVLSFGISTKPLIGIDVMIHRLYQEHISI